MFITNVLCALEIRSTSTTPHTDLAPTLEEDEEQLSDMSFGCVPLKQLESNRGGAVHLRNDMAVSKMTEQPLHKRPLEFRPGVHKSESAKEMLLSQNTFGPLPPSPPSSNPDTFVSFEVVLIKTYSLPQILFRITTTCLYRLLRRMTRLWVKMI